MYLVKYKKHDKRIKYISNLIFFHSGLEIFYNIFLEFIIEKDCNDN